MARKSTGPTRKSTSRPSRKKQNFSDNSQVKGNINMPDYSGSKKAMIMEVLNNPAFKYVMGGIATAVLTKVVTNMADRYPELSNFLRENLDTIEEKLTEFKGTLGDSNTSSRYS